MKSLKHYVVSLIVIIFLFILFGCGTVDNESDGINIYTNSETYNVDSTSTIKLYIQNNSKNPIYYICSGDIYLEETIDGIVIKEWKVHGFEECLAIRSIEPNITKEYNFMYASEYSIFKLHDATYTEEVQFRLRIDFYYDKDLKTGLTFDEKYSNYIYIMK